MITLKSIKQMKRITLLLLASFSVVFTTWSQSKITGNVKDNTGDLPGVSVYVEGNQSIGTTTNTKGEYMITVPAAAKSLVFKFIGKVLKFYNLFKKFCNSNLLNCHIIFINKQLFKLNICNLFLRRHNC